MPIRINLLNEALAEQDLRRRDPVKRALLVGAFLVALALVWFSSTWLDSKLVQFRLGPVQAEIQSHTNDFDHVQANFKKAADARHQLDALAELNTDRFLQGDLMNAVQKIYVPNVQLIRMKVAQSYIYKADKTGKRGVTPAHPGSSTEQIVLTLDAKDSSSNPGDQVSHFKDAIARLPYFKDNLNATNGIRLLNLSASQNADGKPFVLFTVECRFTDKTR